MVTLSHLRNNANDSNIFNIVKHLNALVQSFSGFRHTVFLSFPLDFRTTLVLVHQYIDYSLYKAHKYEGTINLFIII